MADETDPSQKENFWKRLPSGVRTYVIFCVLTIAAMGYANQTGWFPTYGIFSGENSMHSSYRTGGYSFGGGHGIHGK